MRQSSRDAARLLIISSVLAFLIGGCITNDAADGGDPWIFEMGDAPRIELESRAGPVEIEARAGSQIVVRSPAPDVTVEREADTVRVAYEAEPGQADGAGFFITAPRSTVFTIDIGEGALRMQGFMETRVRVRIEEGPVEMDRVEGDIYVTVSTGGVDLRDVLGTVRLSTREGPISINGRLRGSNVIRTGNGGVLVELKGANPLIVDARGSAVDTDFGLGSGPRARGTIGDGSAGSLDIRALEGPVEIRRAHS